MTPNKPYIIRALFEWIVDNELTPYLLVNALSENLMVPEGIDNDDKIILNLSPSAIRDFEMTNEAILFSARFHGKPENLYIPTHAILAIYANENGEGMMFPEDTLVESDESTSTKKKEESKKSSKRPSLTVVK